MAMGRVPARAARVVIMMGRKRTRQAWKMASAGAMPSLRCRSRAKSIIMMAFFLTMPMSMMTPTKA
jgi:hypothetical protein